MTREAAVRVSPELELRYGCDRARLPAALAARFLQLEHDAAARAFVAGALAAPHGPLLTWAYGALRHVLSDYDAYGLLGMYPMHLLSTPQLERLLGPCGRQRLLDVGAGSGGVTAHASPLFAHTAAIDTSPALRRRLRARGFTVLDADLTAAPLPPELERFDAVLCLNVLDRCSHPHTLLRNARAALRDGGTLLVSVPLPLKPHVHVGRFTVDPEERLPAAEDPWEAGAASVARAVLEPAGLAITALSRAPYLCKGDAGSPLYALDAAVFACAKAAA